jgi:PAS domain S-box-containing protein
MYVQMATEDTTAIKIEREVALLLGNRLIGWIIASLWAVAVLSLFHYFDAMSSIMENWLWLISPLLLIRGWIGLVLHRNLEKDPWFRPTLRAVRRFSFAVGVTDTLLIVATLYLFGGQASSSLELLLLLLMCGLAILSMVYALAPLVLMAVMGAAGSSALVMAWVSGIAVSPPLLFMAVVVAIATAVGVTRFQRVYQQQLVRNFSIEERISQASESNFVFNQHWMKTPLAAIDWDSNLTIKSWNPAAERLFGFTADEAVGQGLDLIFAPEEAEKVRHCWTQPDFFGLESRTLRDCRNRLGVGFMTEWFDTALHLDGEFIGVASFVIDRQAVTETQEDAPDFQQHDFKSNVVMAN